MRPKSSWEKASLTTSDKSNFLRKSSVRFLSVFSSWTHTFYSIVRNARTITRIDQNVIKVNNDILKFEETKEQRKKERERDISRQNDILKEQDQLLTAEKANFKATSEVFFRGKQLLGN